MKYVGDISQYQYITNHLPYTRDSWDEIFLYAHVQYFLYILWRIVHLVHYSFGHLLNERQPNNSTTDQLYANYVQHEIYMFSTWHNSLHIIGVQWKGWTGDQSSTRYSLPPSCLNCRRQSDGCSGRGCWIKHLSVKQTVVYIGHGEIPNKKARPRWAIDWIWIMFVMRNDAWLSERVVSECLAVVHVVQHTNLAFGRSAWSTATNTTQFNDGNDVSHTKVPGSAGSLAFGAIDLGERKPVAFVRLVTSVCKYIQRKKYPHYDLCPIDSCLILISALDSGNGVTGMRTWGLR